MKYPVNCTKCNQPLYGPVKYCPFCGVAFASVTATDNKQKLDAFRSEISSSLSKGEYTPDIRGGIRQKGKEIGITEAAADSLLLAVLKEKGFSPIRDGANDSLEVEWCTADKKPKEVTPKHPETTTTEEPQPKPETPVAVKPPIATRIEHPKIPEPVPPPPPPPPKPLFLKVIAGLAIVGVAAGLFYTKKGSVPPPVPKTEQTDTKSQPKGEQSKETRTEVPEPPKPQVEQNFNQRPAATPNLDAEREKMRREAEREALAKIEAERQRQEQAVKQREIDDYLSDGKRFFENGKYELCIEKMREVVRRDNNNREAKQYIRMASEKIDNIKRQFSNPTFGGSE